MSKNKFATNKFNYLYVLQGDYGYGWEDLTCVDKSEDDAGKSIRGYLKDYRENEGGSYRVIDRRESNPEFKESA